MGGWPVIVSEDQQAAEKGCFKIKLQKVYTNLTDRIKTI